MSTYFGHVGSVIITGVVDVIDVIAASGAAQTLPATQQGFDITLSANCTITMPAPSRGAWFYVICRQAASGGPYTVSFSSSKWAFGAPPTMTATASAVDRYDFVSDGTFWYGVVSGQAFA